MNSADDITDGPAAASGSPRQNVQRLVGELRAALVACEEGPLRVIVDSDGAACVQPLAGRPFIRGGRLAGVPVIMARVAEDKARWTDPLDFGTEG